MRLGAMVLSNFCNINDFNYGQLEVNEGNATKICLQLADFSKKVCSSMSGTFYQRYIPPTGSSLTVQVQSIDDSQTISRVATQDLIDPSVWCIDIFEGELLATSNLHLELTEPGPKIRTGVVINAIRVIPTDPQSGHSFC